MSIAIGGSWLVFTALWQAADLPQLALLGAPADFALIAVLVWAYVRTPEDAIVVALAGGLALDVLSGQPPGVTVLALLPATVLGSLRGTRMLDTEWFAIVVLAVPATLAYHATLLLLLSIVGPAPDLGSAVTGQVLPAALLNTLLAPLAYFAIWAASIDARPDRRQIRTAG